MRLGGLVVVWAAVASAQTHVEGSGVAGATVQSGGTVSALSAVDLLLERSFGSTFVASAQLATQLLPSRTGQYAFVDLGSALRVRGRLSSWDDEVVFAELFPFGGRRVRPTFDAANAWGAPPRPSSVAPMLNVGAAWRGASIWAAVQGNEQLFSANVTLVRATGLVGGGVVLPLGFRSDLTLLFQDRGVVPWLASAGVAQSVLAAGGSARLG